MKEKMLIYEGVRKPVRLAQVVQGEVNKRNGYGGKVIGDVEIRCRRLDLIRNAVI